MIWHFQAQAAQQQAAAANAANPFGGMTPQNLLSATPKNLLQSPAVMSSHRQAPDMTPSAAGAGSSGMITLTMFFCLQFKVAISHWKEVFVPSGRFYQTALFTDLSRY